MRFVCGAAFSCSHLYVQVQANANLMDERASLGISWGIITRHKNVSPDGVSFGIPILECGMIGTANLEYRPDGWKQRSAAAYNCRGLGSAARLPNSQHCKLYRLLVGVGKSVGKIIKKRGNFAKRNCCCFVLCKFPHRHDSCSFDQRLLAHHGALQQRPV
jgi:hypothetical protein